MRRAAGALTGALMTFCRAPVGVRYLPARLRRCCPLRLSCCWPWRAARLPVLPPFGAGPRVVHPAGVARGPSCTPPQAPAAAIRSHSGSCAMGGAAPAPHRLRKNDRQRRIRRLFLRLRLRPAPFGLAKTRASHKGSPADPTLWALTLRPLSSRFGLTLTDLRVSGYSACIRSPVRLSLDQLVPSRPSAAPLRSAVSKRKSDSTSFCEGLARTSVEAIATQQRAKHRIPRGVPVEATAIAGVLNLVCPRGLVGRRSMRRFGGH